MKDVIRRRGYDVVVMLNVILVFVDQTSAIGVKGLGAPWNANHVETRAFTTTTSAITLP